MTPVFLLVPATALAGLILLRSKLVSSYTQALIWTFVISMIAVASATELLSVFGALNETAIAGLWLLAFLLLLGSIVALKAWPPKPTISRSQLPALVVITAFFAAETVIALAASPTGADGATYRLPRVMQWLQNQDLAAFPTIVERQIYIPPVADFLVLHSVAITGTDVWVNAPQLFAGVVLVFAAAAIGRWLTGSLQAWSLAAVFAVTTPVVLSQMVAVQSDLISAALVLSALFVSTVGAGRNLAVNAALLAAISAVAIGAKVTGFVLIVPIICYFFWRHRLHLTSTIRAFVLSGLAISLITVIPHLVRLNDVYGSPLKQADSVFNSTFSFAAAFLNIPRVVISLGSVPVTWVNSQATSLMNFLFDSLAGPDSQTIGVFGSTTFRVEPWFTEDYVSAPLQIALTVGFLLIVAFGRIRKLSWLALVIVGQIVLLGGTLLWQPWINRFSFPIAIVGSIGAAALLASKGRILRGSMMALSVLIALPLLLYPKGREWLASPGFEALGLSRFEPRIKPGERRYFDAASSEIAVIDRIEQLRPRSVRLYLPGYGKDGEGSVEYPWWPAIRERLPEIRIEHARSIPPLPPVQEPKGDYVTICLESCPIAPSEVGEQFGNLTLVIGRN